MSCHTITVISSIINVIPIIITITLFSLSHTASPTPSALHIHSLPNAWPRPPQPDRAAAGAGDGGAAAAVGPKRVIFSGCGGGGGRRRSRLGFGCGSRRISIIGGFCFLGFWIGGEGQKKAQKRI